MAHGAASCLAFLRAPRTTHHCDLDLRSSRSAALPLSQMPTQLLLPAASLLCFEKRKADKRQEMRHGQSAAAVPVRGGRWSLNAHRARHVHRSWAIFPPWLGLLLIEPRRRQARILGTQPFRNANGAHSGGRQRREP